MGDQQAQVDAFAVAQSGLERYVALRDSEPGATDSVAIPIGPDDTAYVALFRIRAPVGTIKGQYVLRSRGVSHGGRFSFDTPAAQRTVAQYATWQVASMDLDAAWTSIGGLSKNGHTGTISGIRRVRHRERHRRDDGAHVQVNGVDGYHQSPPPGTPLYRRARRHVRWRARIRWPLPVRCRSTGMESSMEAPIVPDYTLTSVWFLALPFR